MDKLVNLTIDGREVEVQEGTLIIEAAEKAGIHIPRLCYLKGLESVGACRVCLIEIEGNKWLTPACKTKVKDEMHVLTQSEAVIENRKFVIELLLSLHPEGCLSCEKAGICRLQKYAYQLGIKTSRFPKKYFDYEIKRYEPFIERDPNLCILCGMCVRACKEWGNSVLDFMGRGMDTRVGTPDDLPLREAGCGFCGTCIEVCPVGAITELHCKFKGREWELTEKSSICPYCGCGCKITPYIKDGEIIKVNSKDGFLCVKGKFGFDAYACEARVRTPLIRKDNELVPASWDEALSFVAENLQRIKSQDGPEQTGFLGSASFSVEDNYVLERFARCVFSTNNIDKLARFYHGPTLLAFQKALGQEGLLRLSSQNEIDTADTILLISQSATHPQIARKIKRLIRKGAKLIEISSQKTELSELASCHISPRPGTEPPLLAGIMKIMVDEGLYDQEFVAKCAGFDKFSASLKDCPPEITGVPKDNLIEAARLIGSAKSLAIIYSAYLTSQINGTSNVLEVINLSLLKGSFNITPLVLENNTHGANLAGANPSMYPGYYALNDETLKKFKELWKVSDLPKEKGLTLMEMLDGGVKSLYALGDIPEILERYLGNLSFLCVQTTHLTELLKRQADCILPAASPFESDGTFINLEGKERMVQQILPPTGEAEAPWTTIVKLAHLLKYNMDYSLQEEIMNELKGLIPKETEPVTGIFHPVEFEEIKPPDEYPFTLITRDKLSLLSNAALNYSKINQLFADDSSLEICAKDAKGPGIIDGDLVSISSSEGTLKDVYAKVADNLPKGIVSLPLHLASEILDIRLDKESKTPSFSITYVDIRSEKQ